MEPTTDRQRTVARYAEAFREGRLGDAVRVFTEDVRWVVFGAFESVGRDAYLANMSNDFVVGFPDIRISQYFEDGDAVVAEGSVAQQTADGAQLDIRFLDVFQFRGDHVCEKRSYVMSADTAAE